MVAASAHHNGNARSASRPKIVNAAQKTFLCMRLFYRRVTPAKFVCSACVSLSSPPAAISVTRLTKKGLSLRKATPIPTFGWEYKTVACASKKVSSTKIFRNTTAATSKGVAIWRKHPFGPICVTRAGSRSSVFSRDTSASASKGNLRAFGRSGCMGLPSTASQT